MPRQPRYLLPGVPQHVVQRGVDRNPTFFAPSDYASYLRCLRSASRRYECQIHAYVLMTNHVHLLVTPQAEDSIPRVMQSIGREYVQPLNSRYKRIGTLWQARYRASVVQSDFYFLACHRYIEMNPVRAGLVNSPHLYRYSSYTFNALGHANGLVTPHSTYLALGSDSKSRTKAYQYLFSTELRASLIEEIRKQTRSCRPIGGEQFKDQIEAMTGRPARRGKVGRPPKH